MLKISETALLRKFPSFLSSKGKSLLGDSTAKRAYGIVNKPAKEFHATEAIARKEHPLAGYIEDKTRGIVPHRKGLMGKPMNEMKDYGRNTRRIANPVQKDFHPTEPTTDTVDWTHKQAPTMATYRKIKGAISKISP